MAKLFSDNECIKEFKTDWKGSEEWNLVSCEGPLAKRLVRALQVHHAGVTILAEDKPRGSGVLVKSTEGYGVLTAGHVCSLLKEDIGRGRVLNCIPQGLHEETAPDFKHSVLVRPLESLEMPTVYVKDRPTPDYGCIVVPEIHARTMEAWGTFVNITRDGPSRKRDYDLNHNAWLAVGYVKERSPSEHSAYHQNLIGAPEAVYERAGKRYLFLEAQHLDENLPKSIGGMSGSGVWEVPIAGLKDHVAVSLGTPILRGIAFWQEKQKHQEDPLAFYAHELETIADDVVSWLDAPSTKVNSPQLIWTPTRG